MQGLGRRYLLRRTVKDAFDNLPSGICFFDSNGIAVLCNRQMDRLPACQAKCNIFLYFLINSMGER